MSQKMPFTELMSDTFRFAWSELWTITKAMFLPLLLMVIGIFALFLGLLDYEYLMELENVEIDDEDFDAVMAILGSMFRFSWGVTLAVFLVGIWIFSIPLYGAYTNLSRYIGLGERPQNWLAFRFDGPMWRLWIAYFIYGALTWMIYAAAFAIAWSMTPDAFSGFAKLDAIESDPSLLMPLLAFAGQFFLFSIIPMMIVGTKLAPFPAASACENRLMLFNSWSKTKGHFWTILGSYIVLMFAVTMGSFVLEMLSAVIEGAASLLGSLGGGIGAIILIILGIVMFVVSIAYQFFSMGVGIAFPAYVYKYLWRDNG